MPSDSYNGRRKIKGKSKKRSKKSSKRRTSRKNTSKGYDMIDTEFMSNLNMNMKNQQQPNNGLMNPNNLDYDPLHVQYLAPFNGNQQNQMGQFNIGFDQMTQGQQMNGLSSMFPQQMGQQMMDPSQMMMGQQQMMDPSQMMMAQQQMMGQQGQMGPVGQQFIQ